MVSYAINTVEQDNPRSLILWKFIGDEENSTVGQDSSEGLNALTRRDIDAQFEPSRAVWERVSRHFQEALRFDRQCSGSARGY